MIDVERIDDKLYKSIYGIPRVGVYNEICDEIEFCKQMKELRMKKKLKN